MIPRPHDKDGSVLAPDSIALVATADGELHLYLPAGSNLDFSRAQVFISAVALRSTDAEWLDEQVEFILEVRRQFDDSDDQNKQLH